MNDVFVVRYSTAPSAAVENQQLVESVYAALAEARPEGLRYATFRLAEGVTFVHLAMGERSALSEVPAFLEFQRDFGSRVVDGPHAAPATMIGSYGF